MQLAPPHVQFYLGNHNYHQLATNNYKIPGPAQPRWDRATPEAQREGPTQGAQREGQTQEAQKKQKNPVNDRWDEETQEPHDVTQKEGETSEPHVLWENPEVSEPRWDEATQGPHYYTQEEGETLEPHYDASVLSALENHPPKTGGTVGDSGLPPSHLSWLCHCPCMGPAQLHLVWGTASKTPIAHLCHTAIAAAAALLLCLPPQNLQRTSHGTPPKIQA